MKPEPKLPISLSGSRRRLRSRLLAWFDGNGRSLPWRLSRSLYGTWISEVMLQQTTVATVVPYWERFMAAFPDVAALAAADLDEILEMWSGLGYYRRARQLHRAARVLMCKGNGQLPRNRGGWLQLPGIGPYASGAIASIGLRERVPALDANARRVLTRWLVAGPGDLADLRPALLEKIGEDLVDPDRPGDWNEAVMELGALICRASAPACGDCPVRNQCRAGSSGRAHLIPPPKTTAAFERVLLGVLVLAWGDRILLVRPAAGPAVFPAGAPAPVRKDVSGLHRGLWGLPSTPWLPDPGNSKAPWPGRIWRPWLEGISGHEPWPDLEDPALVGKFRHAITRYRLLVRVYGLRLPGVPPREDLFGPQPAISALPTGVSESGAGTAVLARFCPWPGVGQPVSNLVKKSLLVAQSASV